MEKTVQHFWPVAGRLELNDVLVGFGGYGHNLREPLTVVGLDTEGATLALTLAGETTPTFTVAIAPETPVAIQPPF
jgi:hypothetical protein